MISLMFPLKKISGVNKFSQGINKNWLYKKYRKSFSFCFIFRILYAAYLAFCKKKTIDCLDFVQNTKYFKMKNYFVSQNNAICKIWILRLLSFSHARSFLLYSFKINFLTLDKIIKIYKMVNFKFIF